MKKKKFVNFYKIPKPSSSLLLMTQIRSKFIEKFHVFWDSLFISVRVRRGRIQYKKMLIKPAQITV